MYAARVHPRDAVRRLRQDVALSADVDLDAVATRHASDDAVLTLVALAAEIRTLVPALSPP